MAIALPQQWRDRGTGDIEQPGPKRIVVTNLHRENEGTQHGERDKLLEPNHVRLRRFSTSRPRQNSKLSDDNQVVHLATRL